ncbi:aspartate kinase [bacterium]|nr:aspartate kinase [bacterium]
MSKHFGVIVATLLMKFGGSSIGTTNALTQVVSIVLQEHERWDRLIVVASALEGVTDQLIEAAHLAQLANRRGYRRITATLRQRHLSLIDHLSLGTNERSSLQADIDKLLFEMLDICQILADSPPENTIMPDKIDAITGVGERMAARIIAALLRQNGIRSVAIDATELIVTNTTHGSAVPQMEMITAACTQSSCANAGTTDCADCDRVHRRHPNRQNHYAGRGGSDYTASILAVCAGVQEVWVWTDVDGMMTSDPRDIPDAQVIPELSYTEVAELAYFGARILHARMIQPLRENKIPLRVRNVYKPQQPGTVIQQGKPGAAPTLKAVTTIQAIALSALHSGSLAAIAHLVDETLYEAIGSHAEVMISSQSATESLACFVIPPLAGSAAVHTAQIALEVALRESGNTTWRVFPVSIITTVGTSIDNANLLTATIFQSLGSIRILGVSQGPSRCTLSVVVEPQYAETALQRIHALTIAAV